MRYRGGTYSPTVHTVQFKDGTRARTDLVRLNPNIDAYSLDYSGIAPSRPARYGAEDWLGLANTRARSGEIEISGILQHSYPVLDTATLSRNLRDAGFPLGSADIKEHEAIAGTQAAIWRLTNGLELDNRALNVPVAVSTPESESAVVVRSAGVDGIFVHAELVEGRESVVDVEFDGYPQLGGYSVRVGDRTTAPTVTLRLQKSNDGTNWTDVPSSTVTVYENSARHGVKKLGLGSTVSSSSHDKGEVGYRYYRLVLAGAGVVDLDDIRFLLHGSGNYRNSDRVVHLYDYLVGRAWSTRRVRPRLGIDVSPTAYETESTGVIGPFVVRSTHPTTVAVRGGVDHLIVDVHGARLRGALLPGTQFFVRLARAESPTRLSLSMGMSTGVVGRVLTAASEDSEAARFTPLVSPAARRSESIVDFDLVTLSRRRWSDAG